MTINRYNIISYKLVVHGVINTTWDPEDLDNDDYLDNINGIDDVEITDVEEVEEWEDDDE